MRQPALTESIESSATEIQGAGTTAARNASAADARGASHTVTIRVTGCGMTDQESFEVGDVKTAGTAMRKLMAAAGSGPPNGSMGERDAPRKGRRRPCRSLDAFGHRRLSVSAAPEDLSHVHTA